MVKGRSAAGGDPSCDVVGRCRGYTGTSWLWSDEVYPMYSNVLPHVTSHEVVLG